MKTKNKKAFLLAVLIPALSVGIAVSANADEGGVPFWMSGQFASLAAVPGEPGWSLVTIPYYYNGNASAAKTFQQGQTLYAGIDSSAPLLLFQPGYAPKTKIWGGQPFIGVDSHLDWAVSQFLSANWQVGLAGYVYNQLSGDSGSGNQLGSFKSRVAAVGPELGYSFDYNNQSAYFNLRAYYEFWAKNRVEGIALFGTLVLPLGKAGSD